MTVRNRIVVVTSPAVAAILCILLFVPYLFCAAQTTVVDVKDESTVRCPVRMSGTMEFTEWEVDGVNHTSFVNKLSATNLSNLPIVALVTYTSIGNSRGPLLADERQLDAFFSRDLEIAPGQTWTKTRNDNGEFITPFSDKAAKVAPAATSQVIFVQFADGNTCGNANDGRVTSLMDARADLLLALNKWNDAAKIGEDKFLKALDYKVTDRTGNAEGILGNIRDMQKEKGSTAAIEYIRSMLDVAATR
jgi:hypothetical protein